MQRGVVALIAVMLFGAGWAPAAGERAPNPHNVREWLGSWQTNFGRIVVQDIYATDTGWEFVAGWKHQYDGYRIRGQVDPHSFATLHGCFSDRGQGACHALRIDKTGDRITGGFWKWCKPAASCRVHRPWSGEKTDPRWRIDFRFAQHDGGTESSGHGAIVWGRAPQVGSGFGWGLHGSSMVTLDTGTGGQDLRVSVRLKQGDIVADGPHRRELVVLGPITKSNDPNCVVGQRAVMLLTQGRGGEPNRMRYFYNYPSCRDRSLTSANSQLDVVIGAGHRG